MNRKNINSVLCKVHDAFLQSIDDDNVRNLVRTNSIITGGAIVSLLTGEEVHDYDYYFTNKETVLAVTQYYVEKFNKTHDKHFEVKEEDERIKIFIQSEGVAAAGDDESEQGLTSYEEDPMQTNVTPESDVDNVEEKPKYEPVYLTSNAITLRGHIQLVIRFYGDAEEIHKNYDFVHCTNYWTSKDRKVVLNERALEAIINKELCYVGSKYPLCSIIRTRKFINRGWHINAGQYLKMAMQLNKLDLTDVKVLEDQLVGVDSGYFQMLISALQEKQTKDNAFKVDESYVAAIVDKLF
jgi:hypothetical protein